MTIWKIGHLATNIWETMAMAQLQLIYLGIFIHLCPKQPLWGPNKPQVYICPRNTTNVWQCFSSYPLGERNQISPTLASATPYPHVCMWPLSISVVWSSVTSHLEKIAPFSQWNMICWVVPLPSFFVANEGLGWNPQIGVDVFLLQKTWVKPSWFVGRI